MRGLQPCVYSPNGRGINVIQDALSFKKAIEAGATVIECRILILHLVLSMLKNSSTSVMVAVMR